MSPQTDRRTDKCEGVKPCERDILLQWFVYVSRLVLTTCVGKTRVRFLTGISYEVAQVIEALMSSIWVFLKSLYHLSTSST